MKQFWITFFGSVVGVIIASIVTPFILLIVIGAMLAGAVRDAAPETALPRSGMVLELDLRRGRLDQPSDNPFTALSAPLSVVDLVRTMEHAETNDAVAGLFIRANEFGMSPGVAEELRGAIESFSDSGRFVIVHAQGFEGTSVTSYFAVAGADEIWLQDTASFSAAGLAGEIPFLGGLFERFEADPEFVQFYEYKNAANTYTETGFTEAHREATLSYMTSIYDTALAAVSEDRGMPLDAMQSLIEASPHSAEDALAGGLVDQLGHVVEAREAAIARAGNGRLVSIEDYADTALQAWSSGPVIALIEGQGAIQTGSPQSGPFSDAEAIGGDDMAEAILAAANDASVRAIVIRVDSPGGSAIASDQVWHAVNRAREAGKPVVVSMASVAASGGYYIAAPADYVLAHATTLTGSIGVLGGKLVVDDTLGLIGLNVESIAVGGEYATAYSGQMNWTETQREAYRSQMEDIYEDFTGRVADGRDLPLERVLEIARGRVWTGAQALDLGLVDEIGGLRDALDAARELAGIEPGADIRLRRFPAEQSPWEAFQQLFGVQAETAEAAARLNALMELPEVRAAIEAREMARTRGVQMRAEPVQPR